MPEPEAIGQDVASRACDEVGDDAEAFDLLRLRVVDASIMYGARLRAEGATEPAVVEAMRRFDNGARHVVESHIRVQELSDDELLHDGGEIIASADEAAILGPLFRENDVPDAERYRVLMSFRAAEVKAVPRVMAGVFGANRDDAETHLARFLVQARADHAADRSNRRGTDEELAWMLIGWEAAIRRAIRRFYGGKIRPGDLDALAPQPRS